MTTSLMNKHVLLGVCGGIAAYKAAELLRHLKEAGAMVKVIMTQEAEAFVGALTFQALSEEPVYRSLLDSEHESAMGHITLARWADLLLIAPATANMMAKLASGLADDLLSTVALVTTAPLFIAPAMNKQMWEHPATQANRNTLTQRKATILGPDYGKQACGEIGLGRLLEPEKLFSALSCAYLKEVDDRIADSNTQCRNAKFNLQGKKIVVTAGPTQEAMDPIRYLSNHSSGKMGFSIAEAAKQAGAEVVLVAGPVSLETPLGVQRVDVVTALDMYAAVHQHIDSANVFIGCAAVSDYRFETIRKDKHKKTEGTMMVTWVVNPDIVSSVTALPKAPFSVAFAAETSNCMDSIRLKYKHKQVDILVSNVISEDNPVFGQSDNEVTVLTASGEALVWPKASKNCIAKRLMALIAETLTSKLEH
jgi:phosphopantothenoylcysteine decarboxylase / phosphopantothenate---cysteine ligase